MTINLKLLKNRQLNNVSRIHSLSFQSSKKKILFDFVDETAFNL